MELDLNVSTAVIGSIIVVILAVTAVGFGMRRQIKQTKKAPATTRHDKRNHAMLGFRKLLLSDPNYVETWRQGQSGKPLDAVDQVVYNQLFFEYWHAQQEGYLRALEADDQWAIERARETVIADHERLPAAINRLRIGQMLHPDYATFLNQIIEEIKRVSDK